MMERPQPPPNPESLIPILSDDEMETFISLIYDECGISLKPEKRSMMSARIFKRIKALGMESFQDYLHYLDDAQRRIGEITSLIDVMTTNKTDFFREDNHFNFLTQKILPELTSTAGFRQRQMVHCWSAGCSTGEEPYTLAMVLEDYFSTHPGNYSILATDIALKVLRKAQQAIYSEEMILPIPKPLRKQYLLSGKGQREGQYRIVPELRKKVMLGRLNFMDEDYRLPNPMDFIFCRNVIIYFDWDTKIKVLTRIFRYLRPGGYLLVGHSESLNGVNLKVDRVAPTIFKKQGAYS